MTLQKRFPQAVSLISLLITVTLLSSRCKSKIESAPFPLDSLLTFNHDRLVTFTAGRKLVDSIGRNNEGAQTATSIFMPGTPLAVRIEWLDTTRLIVSSLQISDSTGTNLWRTRDSVGVGLSLSDLARINGIPFLIFGDTSTLAQKQLGIKIDRGNLNSWLDGRLLGHIDQIQFRLSADVTRALSLNSNNETLKKTNPKITALTLKQNNLASPIKVESIAFKNNQTSSTSNVPHLIDHSATPSPFVDSINHALMSHFLIESFDPAKEQDFSWTDVNFQWRILDNVFYINIWGTYVSAYPTEYDQEYFYNLQTGAEIQPPTQSFQDLLNEDKSESFFKQYWAKDCDAKIRKAIACADGTNTGCVCSEIKYAFASNAIVLSLDQNDCFPHAMMDCAPDVRLDLSLPVLDPFLNTSTKTLIAVGFFERTKLEQLVQRPSPPSSKGLDGKTFPYASTYATPSPEDSLYTGEIISVDCTFEGIEEDGGDCGGGAMFSCGNIAGALTDALSAEDMDILRKAIDGKLSDRTFAVTYQMARGTVCGDPTATGSNYFPGPVMGLLTFKLKPLESNAN